MPIKPEMRWFYPIDWPQLSRHVRFERAGGVCQGCSRPHGETVRCLPDGRWYDTVRQTWRNHRGRSARWPDPDGLTLKKQLVCGKPASSWPPLTLTTIRATTG
jgi:hypothetical protein